MSDYKNPVEWIQDKYRKTWFIGVVVSAVTFLSSIDQVAIFSETLSKILIHWRDFIHWILEWPINAVIRLLALPDIDIPSPVPEYIFMCLTFMVSIIRFHDNENFISLRKRNYMFIHPVSAEKFILDFFEMKDEPRLCSLFCIIILVTVFFSFLFKLNFIILFISSIFIIILIPLIGSFLEGRYSSDMFEEIVTGLITIIPMIVMISFWMVLSASFLEVAVSQLQPLFGEPQ